MSFLKWIVRFTAIILRFVLAIAGFPFGMIWGCLAIGFEAGIEFSQIPYKEPKNAPRN